MKTGRDESHPEKKRKQTNTERDENHPKKDEHHKRPRVARMVVHILACLRLPKLQSTVMRLAMVDLMWQANVKCSAKIGFSGRPGWKCRGRIRICFRGIRACANQQRTRQPERRRNHQWRLSQGAHRRPNTRSPKQDLQHQSRFGLAHVVALRQRRARGVRGFKVQFFILNRWLVFTSVFLFI